jgi:hypothetical protein
MELNVNGTHDDDQILVDYVHTDVKNSGISQKDEKDKIIEKLNGRILDLENKFKKLEKYIKTNEKKPIEGKDYSRVNSKQNNLHISTYQNYVNSYNNTTNTQSSMILNTDGNEVLMNTNQNTGNILITSYNLNQSTKENIKSKSLTNIKTTKYQHNKSNNQTLKSYVDNLKGKVNKKQAQVSKGKSKKSEEKQIMLKMNFFKPLPLKKPKSLVSIYTKNSKSPISSITPNKHKSISFSKNNSQNNSQLSTPKLNRKKFIMKEIKNNKCNLSINLDDPTTSNNLQEEFERIKQRTHSLLLNLRSSNSKLLSIVKKSNNP